MKLKKILAAVLAALTAISFASCGDDSDDGGGGGGGGRSKPSGYAIEGYEEYGGVNDILGFFEKQAEKNLSADESVKNLSMNRSEANDWDEEFEQYYYDEMGMDPDEKLDGDKYSVTVRATYTRDGEKVDSSQTFYFLKDKNTLEPIGMKSVKGEESYCNIDGEIDYCLKSTVAVMPLPGKTTIKDAYIYDFESGNKDSFEENYNKYVERIKDSSDAKYNVTTKWINNWDEDVLETYSDYSEMSVKEFNEHIKKMDRELKTFKVDVSFTDDGDKYTGSENYYFIYHEDYNALESCYAVFEVDGQIIEEMYDYDMTEYIFNYIYEGKL